MKFKQFISEGYTDEIEVCIRVRPNKSMNSYTACGRFKGHNDRDAIRQFRQSKKELFDGSYQLGSFTVRDMNGSRNYSAQDIDDPYKDY